VTLFYWIYKIFGVIIALVSFVFGGIAIWQPNSVIKFQQRFCERINWKVEPISWEIEIRSTKRFGRILILLGAVLLTLIVFIKI